MSALDGEFRYSPVPLKLCPNLDRLLPPQVATDVPVQRIVEVSLVQRFDV